MVTYTCDGCGKEIPQKALRYKAKIDIRAAYDTLEIKLADLLRDHEAELRALIEKLKGMDPQKIEDDIYKIFRLDLCPDCYHSYIMDPLRFHPEAAVRGELEFDIDEFLKQLINKEQDEKE
jgi:acetone carboxylase gamma subunit